MKTKHTRVRWHIGVRQPTSDKFIYGPKGEEIADCDMKTNSLEENLANARLVAASPEMLAILKEYLQRMDRRYIQADLEGAPIPEPRRDKLYLKMKSIIAKAEGKL